VRTAIAVVLALIVVEGAVGIPHAKAAARQALSYDDGCGDGIGTRDEAARRRLLAGNRDERSRELRRIAVRRNRLKLGLSLAALLTVGDQASPSPNAHGEPEYRRRAPL
jgi:hypothetical protein